MSEHEYKLNYFEIRGRAEVPRLLFHYADVKFEDNKIPAAEWFNIKSDTKRFPLKQIPTLEIDGKVVCQSIAISRFLARRFGLYGNNDLEMLDVDAIIDTITEMFPETGQVLFKTFGKEDERKEQLKQTFESEKMKNRFHYLESILKENISGYFVGDKITLADLLCFVYFEFFLNYYPSFFDGHDILKHHRNKLLEDERISEYIKTRAPMKWMLIDLHPEIFMR